MNRKLLLSMFCILNSSLFGSETNQSINFFTSVNKYGNSEFNSTNKEFETIQAIMEGDEPAVKELLKKGCYNNEDNIVDQIWTWDHTANTWKFHAAYEASPLSVALSKNHSSIATLLIKHGIQNTTPFTIIHSEDQQKTPFEAIDGTDSNSPTIFRQCTYSRQHSNKIITPLYIAVRNNDHENVTHLLNFNPCDNEEYKQTITALLEPYDPDPTKKNASHLTKSINNYPCYIDTFSLSSDNNFETPLFRALANNNEKLALELIKSGADVNKGWISADGSEEILPLSIARSNHLSTCIQALKDRKAVEEPNFKHDVLIKNSRNFVEPFPLINDDNKRSPLLAALLDRRSDIALKLINDNLNDINNKYEFSDGSKGVTPLFLACKNGMAACVVALLEHGANPNAPITYSNASQYNDIKTTTPLHINLTQNETQTRHIIMSALIHFGADIETVKEYVDGTKRSLLNLAETYNLDEDIELLKTAKKNEDELLQDYLIIPSHPS